jgi:hypothetical protein
MSLIERQIVEVPSRRKPLTAQPAGPDFSNFSNACTFASSHATELGPDFDGMPDLKKACQNVTECDDE